MKKKSFARILGGNVIWLQVFLGGGLAHGQPEKLMPAREPVRELRPCVLLAQPLNAGDALWNPNLWPGGIVPYEFEPTVSSNNRALMRGAMNALEATANVHFVPRSGQGNHVYIQESTGNSSFVGMLGGRQIVNIFNWEYKFVICHELMHALGVQHEQSRSDRGLYVQINLNNVCQTCCPGGSCNHNFNIAGGATPVGPYDFDSVMHYGGWAWSSNGQPTITPMPPYGAWQTWMGLVDHLSQGDRDGLVSRYGVGPQGEQLILNGDFQSIDGWVVSPAFYADSRFACSHSGPGYAYLSAADGSPGNSLTGIMYHNISIPSGATSALLRFWYSIATQDPSTTTGHDFLFVTIQNSSGTANLATIRLLSNLDRTGTGSCTSYVQSGTYDIANFAGQTVRLNFLGSTDGTLPTVFRIDDVSVVATVPIGACCVAGTVCRSGVTQSLCASLSGVWQGPGSTACSNCQPQATGACCFANGNCSLLTAAQCSGQSGVYQGDNSSCATANCPSSATGACCLPNYTCAVLSQSNCSFQSGTYRGNNVTCAAASCPLAPSGACCLPNLTCVSTTAASCMTQSGSYRGDGTDCAMTNCAQWTVINLHPVGAAASRALGVSGGQQVGRASFGGISRPGLWIGSAASWVNLTPLNGLDSTVYGVHAGQQVGNSIVSGVNRASLWTGSAASWVDISPTMFDTAIAYGVNGGHQVGVAHVDNIFRASLWSGTAASWVDLNPIGSTQSRAYGIDGGQQVGEAQFGTNYRAVLWSGTAASWVDLNPAGTNTASSGRGIHGGQQVGWAYVGGVGNASLWTGSAASWTNLNPAGSIDSIAFGVHRGQQVGKADVGGFYRASLWSGTAASWVDLHAFLPPAFTSSEAVGIWHDESSTYVVGYGYSNSNAREESLMWVGPPLFCYANCDGSTTPPVLNVNDFQCFLNRFASADPFANCDHSTTPPVLNVNDFLCYLNQFAAGCP